MNSFLYFLGVFAILTLAQRLSATSYSDEPEWSDIIGGETIEQENSLPMLVTININLTTKVELLGGGFILTKDWILTVGHLFYQFEEEDFANVLVGYGSLKRTKQSFVKVDKIYSTYFNFTTRLGDIAFLHVPNIGQNIFSDTMSMKMVIKDTSKLNDSINLLLAGFGSTSTSARRVPSDDCKVATLLHSVPLAECRQQLYSRLPASQQKHVTIDANSNFCLGSLNQTACYGDSGSAVFELSLNRTVHVYGLTSWGSSSCGLGIPNVFTKLFHYRTLIHNITGFDHWLP